MQRPDTAWRNGGGNPYNQTKRELFAYAVSIFRTGWTLNEIRTFLLVEYPELQWSAPEVSQLKFYYASQRLIDVMPGETRAFKPGKRYRWKGGTVAAPTRKQAIHAEQEFN